MAVGLMLCSACGGGKTVARAPQPSSTSTTVVSTTVADVPSLPQPEDSPSDPYADVPVRQIGTIRIPKIGLTHPVFEGIWLTVIDNGPGHWPGSARPGEVGNTVFAGHRVTHTRPFRNIDQLVPGDQVFFDDERGTFEYRVNGMKIVTPKDTWIVDQTRARTMTIFACHPPGSAAERIVVTGEFVATTRS